jgi:hypothetical protein
MAPYASGEPDHWGAASVGGLVFRGGGRLLRKHAKLKDRWCCDPTISSNSPNEASTGWSTEEGVAAVSGGGRDHRKSRKGDWQPPLLN